MNAIITLIGGDNRTLRMESILQTIGYSVQTLGLHPEDETKCDLSLASTVLLPYPFAIKKGFIPTQTDLKLNPVSLLSDLPSHAVIVAGQGLEDPDIQEILQEKQCAVLQYAMAKSFLETNADISAEAAVYEAMQRFEETVDGMPMLVVGYGLFGRSLAKRLLALGAKVTVCVRRESARDQACLDGMNGILIDELMDIAKSFSMVLNTVPSPILSTAFLKALPQKAVLLELASAPYGFDSQVAKSLGLYSVTLPALPAKYAPQSAATALARASLQLLKEGI